jgi:hypothetical protein
MSFRQCPYPLRGVRNPLQRRLPSPARSFLGERGAFGVSTEVSGSARSFLSVSADLSLCHPERSRGTPDLSRCRGSSIPLGHAKPSAFLPRLSECTVVDGALAGVEKNPGSLGCARDDTKIKPLKDERRAQPLPKLRNALLPGEQTEQRSDGFASQGDPGG